MKLPDRTETELEFDHGFVCLGMRANAPILQALNDTFGNSGNAEIMNIGDSVRAGRSIEGTTEGRNHLLGCWNEEDIWNRECGREDAQKSCGRIRPVPQAA